MTWLAHQLAVLLLVTAASFEAVSTQARLESAWSATYQGVILELGSLWMQGINAELARREQLDIEDLDLALRYFRNYPTNPLRVDWILHRYPHYDPEALISDFRRLESIGLLETSDHDNWTTTEHGDSLVRNWYEVAAEHAAPFEEATSEVAGHMLEVLDELVQAAQSLESEKVRSSLRWRLEQTSRVPDDSSLLLKIDERAWDYVAFINENAHYRFDRYAKAHDSEVGNDMSRLAREVFGAMRSGRTYSLARCLPIPTNPATRSD